MDTKKFEALLTSAQLGSFTKAAQELGVTQSGLTHMMNALEQELGFPLLERGHYGTHLTERGQAAFETSHQVFFDWDREVLAPLTEAERAALLAVLEKAAMTGRKSDA